MHVHVNLSRYKRDYRCGILLFMSKEVKIFQKFYRRLKRINDRVMGIVATILFTLIYILIMPWFAVFVKKPRSQARWLPWTFRSETIEDLHRQY
jgi:hypothetical protein